MKKGVDVKKMTKDNKVRFTLRIPKAVYEALTYAAEQKGIATNSEISDILWRHIKETKAGGDQSTFKGRK